MSHAAVTAVLERSKSKGLARLVFVCIAERMDKYGHTFCSLRDIADRAAIGRKNAPRLIKELLKSGELSVVEKGTRTKSNVYQMAPVLMVRTPRALKVRTPCPQGKGRGVLKVKEGCPQGEGPTILVPSLLPVPDFISQLRPLYPGIDLDREVLKMRAWFLTPKGSKRKLTKAFVVNWLNKIDAPVELANSHRSCL